MKIRNEKHTFTLPMKNEEGKNMYYVTVSSLVDV